MLLPQLIKIMQNYKTKLIIIISFISIQGCLNLGPLTINKNRNNYNSIIQKTNDEQLLLNLVRLKYHDTPFFMEIANVTSQHKFSTNLNTEAIFPNSGLNIFDFGGGAGVSESPVVTYSPLQGQKFIQQFLAKMKLTSIFLLYKSGWSIDKILRLCFEKMGHLENAPNASGPTPNSAPIYKGFLRAAKLFRELEKKNAINIFMEEVQGEEIMTLKLDPSVNKSPATRELNNLFNKTKSNLSFKFGLNDLNINFDIETRSLLGIMYYLSHGIETPLKDIEKGYVTRTLDIDGKVFYWSNVTGDLLKIYVQHEKPSHASVEIFYNENWYYIKKSDLISKSTFSFLAQIFFLQAGNFERTAPLITIPIGNN
tara:strand:+ start:5118 stop:6221 length:1104 start_codon:yes stop_codon:yes gene_type:complete